MINKGDNGTTQKIFWDGSQNLNLIANKTIWFDSNGNTLTPNTIVTQQVTPASPKINKNITIVVTVANNGQSNSSGLQITDQIPTGMTLVSATPSIGTYSPATGIWNVGNLNINNSATLTLIVRTNTVKTYTNIAAKTAENEYEPYNATTQTSQSSIIVT